MNNLAVTTEVHEKLITAYDSGLYNIFVLEGSSRSSKTYSIIQFWIKYAYLNNGKQKRVAICRLKGTWLSATILFEFINILIKYNFYDPKKHNKTNKIYTLFTTEFWFMGLDDAQKVHGFESDAFQLNEGIECSYNDYAQLMQRCKGFCIIDYNPSEEECWIYDKILKRPKTWYSHSTFNNNRFISRNAKEQILSYEPNEKNYANGTADKNKWKIYGLGQRATIEGLIINNWDTVPDIPATVLNSKHSYAVDFGYTNDPTAIPNVYWSGNEMWVDEICYRTHLTNPEIGKILIENGLKSVKGYGDSAEPKSIDEIHRMGINIHPAIKGPDSIKNGIDILKRFKIHLTVGSINAIKEFKNYTYKQDKNGKYLNEPIDDYNHFIDGVRYIALAEMGAGNSYTPPKYSF